MKKFILAAILVVSSLTASAQIWVGGGINLGFNTPNQGKTTTTFGISPTVGYSLNDKFDLGLTLNESVSVCDGTTSNNITVEPFARYTFYKTGIVSFFVDGGFSVGSESNSYTDKDDDDEEYTVTKSKTAFTIGFRPGVKFEVTEHLELESHLGWIGYKNVKDSYSDFTLTANSTVLLLGLIYKF